MQIQFERRRLVHPWEDETVGIDDWAELVETGVSNILAVCTSVAHSSVENARTMKLNVGHLPCVSVQHPDAIWRVFKNRYGHRHLHKKF